MNLFIITTNHQARPIITWSDLSAAEVKDMDHLDAEDGASFFRYRGAVYDLGEFELIRTAQTMAVEGDDALRGWDGIRADSFSSGIVVRYANDFEDVIVGTAVW